jgi:leucyl-tRNA synthetase
MSEYPFREIEKRWQQYWAENKTFRALNPDDPEFEKKNFKGKYYVLDMFPYPSGTGLHVGHPLGYIASDIVARYKRHCGYNLLHPMGYDSFGLPAEQYAIQTGQHPAITTEQNIKRYREQLQKLGLSYDWDREVKTSDPDYYRWTQWIFLKLFNSWYNPETDRAEPIDTLIPRLENFSSLTEKEQSDLLMNYRLAYLSEAWVNWCPALGTVLANDEVKDGVSERGGFPVERRKMPQWSLRITAYAERLLKDLETIDWSESIKEAQRNWIGKSQGAIIRFNIADSPSGIEVFTTRPDTIFGVTFLALAPEHELAEKIATAGYKKQVDDYVQYARNRSERDRQADVKTISGQFTGSYAIHPFTNQSIPIWIAEYVLAGYGTGAIMGVPAHDSRDLAFAKHFGLPIKKVIQPDDPALSDDECYEGYAGKCIHSDFINGLTANDAIEKVITEAEKRGVGKRQVNYRLRDAVFGRQRYWGEPIPIYYKDGIPHAVDENDLPVVLPQVDKYLPTETGEPPLARAASTWKYKGKYEFEKTTMPGWAGSSWYFLRYMDAKNKEAFAGKKAIDYWNQIDLYIGGAEHTTGHLLYFRFWTKFLYDLGYLPFQEPARKLINQGMIQGISEKVFKPRDVSSGSFMGSALDDVWWYVRVNIPEIDVMLKEKSIPIPDFYRLNRDKNFLDLFRIEVFISKELVKSEYESRVFQVNLDSRLFDNSRLNLHRFVEMERMLNRNKPEANHLYVFISSDGVVMKQLHSDWSDVAQGFRFYSVSEVEKMSKSRRNVITPDTDPETGQPGILDLYGADCLRMYEMFLGPLEQHKPWNTNGITGVFHFLKKLWRLYHLAADTPPPAEENIRALKVLHRTIKKITEDIENYSFNTAVSAFMICVNELTELKCHSKDVLEPLCILISPFAPHLAEELWHRLGHQNSIAWEPWPVYDEKYLQEDTYEYPVSINGKTRFKVSLPLTMEKEEVAQAVLATEEIKRYLQGEPKKVIVVPGRIVNVVT